jgi:hypothetical protein
MKDLSRHFHLCFDQTVLTTTFHKYFSELISLYGEIIIFSGNTASYFTVGVLATHYCSVKN